MNPAIAFLLIFTGGALVILALTAILNVLTFPRLGRTTTRPPHSPHVSILIPARNEAPVIAQTVTRILAQTYSNLELIVLDDASEDDTGAILHDLARQDDRMSILQGQPLPHGWMGKSWACHQLAQSAQGEILIFVDADVHWERDALQALVADMLTHRTDLATVWSTQITRTWAERCVVPLMSMVITAYLPVVMVHHTPWAIFAAANGQCMAWRRHAYEALGGHERVANNVLDDVTLARATKAHGYRLRMLDAQSLIHCRMYDGWTSVRDGFAKNILAGYGNSVTALLLATLFHWLIFLMPIALLFVSDYRAWGIALLTLGLSIRALSASFTRQRLLDALTLPIGVLLMTRIATRALTWHLRGGVRWKGRTIPIKQAQEQAQK